MNRIIRNSLSSIIVLVLSACNLFGPQTTIIGNNPAVKLTVQTQNGATTFSQAGEIITYNYVITNTGATPLAGPVVVTDGSKLVTCPAVNTVGNKDNYLDTNETITCTAPYTISQADVTTGSVTNVATATLGGVASVQTGITLTLGAAQPSAILKLAKTSSSQTYGKAGESITYTYNITNTGTTPLGPSQFTVTDNKLAAPVNCGPGDTTLAPNQSVSCIGTYVITQADMNLANVTNSATASGGGQTSAAASVTITNLAAPITQVPPTTQPPSNLTPGTTIQHQVAVGEWLIQIVRCYGATYNDVRNANPQISDPDFILPSMIVTVPRIGSSGKIYGPPCISFYTVQAGDSWPSIAQRYNADIAVLQKVNPVALTAGTVIKIPLNSAGSTIGVTPVPAGTTAVPPTASTTPVIRITIDPGQTSAARVGVINPNETIHYVLAAAQGQTLSIKLTAPANEVAIGVNSPTGIALKPLDASPAWSTTVTESGDYAINLMSLTGGSSKSYTLEVSLTSPAATATNTPTTPTAP
ncbi:MAG TPA: LysM peptidoglycan-binding domain-containing protein [Anaerolineales bacterium]